MGKAPVMDARSSTAVDGDLSMEVEIIISPAAADELQALESVGNDAARAQQQNQSSEPRGGTTTLRPRVMRPMVNCITQIFVVRNARIRACAWVPGAERIYSNCIAELELAASGLEIMSSCSSRASCESSSDIDQYPFSVLVLKSGSTYCYTIPSFCAIQMNLIHVVLQTDGVNNLDAFVRVGNGVPSFDRLQPARILVVNCCIVPVSFFCCEYLCIALYTLS